MIIGRKIGEGKETEAMDIFRELRVIASHKRSYF